MKQGEKIGGYAKLSRCLTSSSFRMTCCFIIWSFAVILFFHHKACAPELRYTIVAEGNISHVVHEMWVNGFSAYFNTLKDDAKVWGRLRPMHWIYYNIPFFLTLVRNGDFFRYDPNVYIANRINGDLQTHVLFLITTLAIASGIFCLLIWRFSRVWWITFLFPIVMFSSYIINENLIVYHCDSGEIGQLLFITFYLLGISASFEGQIPKLSHEVFSSIFLFLCN